MRIRRMEFAPPKTRPHGKKQYAAPKSGEGNKPYTRTAFSPSGLFRNLLQNPNLGFQIMVILLTLASENTQMDRRIEGMTSTVEKIRGITDILTSTMSSVKVAAEAPRMIRQILE